MREDFTALGFGVVIRYGMHFDLLMPSLFKGELSVVSEQT